MEVTTTITRTRRDGRAEITPTACLFLVLRADQPLAVSQRWSLRQISSVAIGRGDPAGPAADGRLTIRLPDARMSTRHARLVAEPGGFLVVDEGSKNGTFVDGARVERRSLRDGDILEVGSCFFLFRGAVALAPDEPAHLSAEDAAVCGVTTLHPELAVELRAVAAVAASPEPILVGGETGTGKEVLARAIHAASGRAGALIAVNCAALPEALVESELFGYRRGAFSGATGDRDGLIRAAHEGTLFLDEVAELRPSAQAALLRSLQERSVQPLGATSPVPVSFRVVAATHQDLGARVADGRFREDLHARLRAFELRLPPLRERREDLGILIAALLDRIAGDGAPLVRFGYEAAGALLRHPWPRNVRELERTLGTALALAEDAAIDVAHLRLAATAEPAPAEPSSRRDELVRLLGQHAGNVTAVARALGCTRMQIYRWAKRYAIALDAQRPGEDES